MEPPSIDDERAAHRAVVRTALIYTPLFLAGIAITTISILGIFDAGTVLTVIEALVTALFGYQSVQAVRDLRAPLVRTEGVIGRRWSRSDFIISRSYYISVGRNIFPLPIEKWYDLAEDDVVLLTHYPHTTTVVTVEKLPKSPPRERRP